MMSNRLNVISAETVSEWTVNITIPITAVFEFCRYFGPGGMTYFEFLRDGGIALLQHRYKHWCTENNISFKTGGSFVYRGDLIMEFQFERQEDGALFKLWWG
jgi:hypothetical protein